jgi:DNA-directed RNA polymerase subunit RPC12/RpoP
LSKTYVRCEACRSEFRSIEWREGLTCPGCGSAQLIPVEYEDEGEGAKAAAGRSETLSALDAERELSEKEKFDWKKSAAVGAIAAIAIVVGVVVLAKWMYGTRKVTYTLPYQCAECGYVTEYYSEDNIRPPIRCGKCGKETLYRQWRCGDCGQQFALKEPRMPEEVDESTLTPEEIEARRKVVEAVSDFSMKCPECDSSNIFEEYTKSHKKALVKNQEWIGEDEKKRLAERYGIEF